MARVLVWAVVGGNLVLPVCSADRIAGFSAATKRGVEASYWQERRFLAEKQPYNWQNACQVRPPR